MQLPPCPAYNVQASTVYLKGGGRKRGTGRMLWRLAENEGQLYEGGDI